MNDLSGPRVVVGMLVNDYERRPHGVLPRGDRGTMSSKRQVSNPFSLSHNGPGSPLANPQVMEPTEALPTTQKTREIDS